MPYIKLKVYSQTVLLDGGHGQNVVHGLIGPLDPPVGHYLTDYLRLWHYIIGRRPHNFPDSAFSTKF